MSEPSDSAPSNAELEARKEAERQGLAFLLYRDDRDSQHIFTLEDSSYRKLIIGRDANADINLFWDGRVSGLHAELERMGDDWALVDDGLSRNGTFVNGERLTGRRKLRDGDLTRFGETIVLFRRPSIGSAEATLDAATNAGLEAHLLNPDKRSESG
jgi:pSer/pThr/pTyr-binding forkhead associated (FHA) protein